MPPAPELMGKEIHICSKKIQDGALTLLKRMTAVLVRGTKPAILHKPTFHPLRFAPPLVAAAGHPRRKIPTPSRSLFQQGGRHIDALSTALRRLPSRQTESQIRPSP